MLVRDPSYNGVPLCSSTTSKRSIKLTRERLRYLNAKSMTQDELGEERALKSRIDALWIREEIYWKQRSMLNWLKYGDRSTKFFHQTTISRRIRNTILRIQDGDGVWIEGDMQVRKEIYNFYKDLFTSQRETQGRDRTVEDVLECVPDQITGSINQELTGMASAEEVKRAVFQMGGGLRRRVRMAYRCLSFKGVGTSSVQTSSLRSTHSSRQVSCLFF